MFEKAKIRVGNTVDFEHEFKDDDDVVISIASPTTLSMHLRKPDGTVVTKTATLVSDGTDGKLHYQTLVSDLDVIGDWTRQFYVKLASSEWTGNLFKFTVHRKLA
jgi:hypothetical protein